jgi:hypothetical protein
VVLGALTAWGTCLTILAVAAVLLITQLAMAEADPRGLLSYLLGAVTAAAGITLMLDV